MSRILAVYKKAIDGIEKAELFVASFLLAALACLIMLEVVSRYLFNHPFHWVFELTMLMITYIVFVGFPVMYRQKSLIILEFVFNKFSKKTQEFLSLIWEVLIGIFLIFLTVASYDLQAIQKRYTSPTLDISFQYFTIPILFCAVSMLLFNADFILFHLRQVWGGNRKRLSQTTHQTTVIHGKEGRTEIKEK
ncbi:MAG: TRAP transporter small permease [Deltaproteobacteria bacterium]|nr:MAG: TRAP transporter small permease [Deltaproteobacteria bacterium]